MLFGVCWFVSLVFLSVILYWFDRLLCLIIVMFWFGFRFCVVYLILVLINMFER